MTATNHAVTGALIGLYSGNALVAVPAAVLSHFVCDALPHFTFAGKDKLTSLKFKKLLIADASLCLTLVLVLAYFGPQNWLLAAVCAFAATSPDLMWLPKFLRAQAGQPKRQNRHIFRFHEVIQWFERPIGAFVEVVWFAAGVSLLKLFIR